MQFALVSFISGLIPSLGLPPKYANPLSYVDLSGKLDATWEIGDINIAGGIPFFVDFNTGKNLGGIPLLGENWNLPIAESIAIKTNENTVVVKFPTGREMKLFKRKNDTNMYAGQGWTAELTSKTGLAVYSENEMMLFNRGRLYKLIDSNKREYIWKYNQGKVTDILEGNSKIASFNYNETGMMQGGSFVGTDDSEVTFEFGRDLVRKGNSQIPQSILSSLTIEGGDKYDFEYQFEKGQGEFLELMNGKQFKSFAWSLEDGKILKVDENDYLITQDGKYTKIDISANGEYLQGYSRDANSETRREGKMKTIDYYLDIGDKRSLPRKTEEWEDDKLVDTVRFYYDDNGTLLKHTSTLRPETKVKQTKYLTFE